MAGCGARLSSGLICGEPGVVEGVFATCGGCAEASQSVSPTHPPFVAGKHFTPPYYKQARNHPSIDHDVDVDDFLWAFGIDDPYIRDAIEYLMRAGKKPGEPFAKDLDKACEKLQRRLSFMAMEDGQ